MNRNDVSDRENVIRGLNSAYAFIANRVDEHWDNYECNMIKDALKLLKEQPEIVRCGECKYNSGRCQGLYVQFVTCYRTGTPHKENWYCADGEMK